MSEAIEIEYKTMLSFGEYQKLVHHYQLKDQDFFSQTNAYYDSADGKLRATGWGLRIRLYSDKAEATLKTPVENGLLETTDYLDLADAQQYVAEKKFLTTGNIVKKLNEIHISPQQLKQFAKLTTKRAEFKIPEGLLAIDHSVYSGQEDFELELEVSEAIAGKNAFEKLLKQLSIEFKPAENKIKRAFNANQTQ